MNWGALGSTLFRVESFRFDVFDNLLKARHLLAATNLLKFVFVGNRRFVNILGVKIMSYLCCKSS